MNICFIFSFIATYKYITHNRNICLYSKNSTNKNEFDYGMPKGVSPFRINRKTSIELNPNQDNKKILPEQIIDKLNRMMRKHNADKVLNNRPLRHYPNHHYKRLIKQRKGFQMSDARRKAYISIHTKIRPKDDIAFLRDEHMDKILEAVDAYDKWSENVEEP